MKSAIKSIYIILSLYPIVSNYIVYSNPIELQELTANLQNLSNIKVVREPAGLIKPIKEQRFDFKETIVSIGGVVKSFDKQTPCNIEKWSNKLENTCKCCLIKNAPLLDQGKKPSEIIKICSNKNECNSSVIQEFLNQEKIENNDEEEKLRELISHIYNNSVIVKEVLPYDIKFDPQGKLTESGVKELLVQAYRDGKLNDSNFSSVSCLNAKNILSQSSGRHVKQLFLVTSNCLNKKVDYILKDMEKGLYEVGHLQASSIISSLRPYIFPNFVPGFPSFIFPVAYISYNYAGKDHFLSLMLKAPGISLSSLLAKYKEQAISKSEVELAFYQTGSALSRFHQLSLSGSGRGRLLHPIQGDAHQENVFYDKATNQVIFIDNDSMSVNDVAFLDLFLFVFGFLWNLKSKNTSIINDQAFLNDWIMLTIKSFLKGYIDAYKIEDRYKELEGLILKFTNKRYYPPRSSFIYDEYLKSKTIYDKIFEELKNLYKDY